MSETFHHNQLTWTSVSADDLCPICNRPDWCAVAESSDLVTCRRESAGALKEKTDAAGATYWVHRRPDAFSTIDRGTRQSKHLASNWQESHGGGANDASPTLLDRGNRTILESLQLSPAHREALRDRGLSDEQINRGAYKTLTRQGRYELASSVFVALGDDAEKIPGLIRHDDREARAWSLAGPSGLVIPVRDLNNRIVALKVRRDEPGDGPKYLYISSKKKGGRGPGAPVHIPVGASEFGVERIRVTEGELKADVATVLSGTFTVSVPGVSSWSSAMPILDSLAPREVVLAFDADAARNPVVAAALASLWAKLRDRSWTVGLESWDEGSGKGIDDLLSAGHTPEISWGDEAEAAIRVLSTGEDQASIEDRIASLSRSPEEDWPEILARVDADGILQEVASARGKLRFLTAKISEALSLDHDEQKDLRDAIKVAGKSFTVSNALASDSSDSSGAASERLIEIALRHKLVHDEENVSYILIDDGERRMVQPVEGREFSDWLAGECFGQDGVIVGDSALKSVIRVLCARAKFQGERKAVHLRVCYDDDVVWYDLADPSWRALRIDRGGWSIVSRPSVLFRRYKKTSEQVEPVRGGRIDELRPFLRIRTEHDWQILIAWIVAGFIPGTPRPVLVFSGEQGTAKSTSARVLRRLIDPSIAEGSTPPDQIREYAQSAKHSWMIVYDNVSKLSPWLSDALCRAATGDAFEKRGLFTDEEDIIWVFRRVVVLNGIGSVIERPDLLDRAVLVTLEPFEESERQAEKVFWGKFEEVRPRILGSILDLLSGVLRTLPDIEASTEFRMQDFVQIGQAVEKVARWPAGSFIQAMRGNADLQVQEGIEASPVALPVLQFMDGRDSWSGTASDLLDQLRRLDVEGFTKELPKASNALSKELKRSAPSLRKLGIDIRMGKRVGNSGVRTIEIESTRSSSATSATSAEKETLPAFVQSQESQSTYPEGFRSERLEQCCDADSADDADDDLLDGDDLRNGLFGLEFEDHGFVADPEDYGQEGLR